MSNMKRLIEEQELDSCAPLRMASNVSPKPTPSQVKQPVCQECAARDIMPERIYDLGGMSTLMSYPIFFDGEGKRHDHDDNRFTCGFQCSNGHRFAQVVPHTCWCGWVQEI